ncbi:MAG: YicC/YloC family endoribonuclease [Phycisphaeraceae bacterium]
MTGFGDASAQVDGIHYHVELRSLNNKYFKASIRLPDSIAGLEAELESHLRKRVHRGSLTLTIKLRISDAHAASQVNEPALLVYLDHLETIHAKIQDQAVQIDLTQLLALPGVLQPSEDEQTLMNKARPALLELIDQAAERLHQMRKAEGEALAADLLAQRDVIHDRLQIIRDRAPKVVEEYHQRLRSRVDELMARAELSVGETDLIREVAVFADRADISEEVSRVAGHLEQFEQVINNHDKQPAGRTLDFIAQELLREANTMASKSNDADINRAAVDMKSAIDRIKEQAQNVE